MLFCFLPLLLTGCGDSGPPTYPAKGTVTYKDKPLTFGRVLFQPAQGQPAKAEIQSDGSFTLTTGTRDGAVAGEHKVTVMCNEIHDPNFVMPTDSEPAPGKSLIPAKYDAAATSGLTFSVTASGDNNFSIVLTDD